MTEFQPESTVVENEHSDSCVTTTALQYHNFERRQLLFIEN